MWVVFFPYIVVLTRVKAPVSVSETEGFPIGGRKVKSHRKTIKIYVFKRVCMYTYISIHDASHSQPYYK